MIKTAYAVAVSAIAASLFVAFPSLSQQVGASAPIIGAKGDRADVRPLGTECGEKARPYFDAAGAPPHMLAAWFKSLTNIDVVLVTYRGGANVLSDLLGG